VLRVVEFCKNKKGLIMEKRIKTLSMMLILSVLQHGLIFGMSKKEELTIMSKLKEHVRRELKIKRGLGKRIREAGKKLKSTREKKSIERKIKDKHMEAVNKREEKREKTPFESLCIASGNPKGTIELWDSKNYTYIKTLGKPIGPISSKAKMHLSFNPNNPDILASTVSSTYIGPFTDDIIAKIQIWNIQTGENLKTIIKQKDTIINQIKFSPDGKYVATVGEKEINIWISESGTWTDMQSIFSQQKPGDSVAFSPNSKYLAFGAKDGSVKIWNAETNAWVSSIGEVRRGPKSTPIALLFSQDGKKLTAVFSRYKSLVKTWETERGLWENKDETQLKKEFPVKVSFKMESQFAARGTPIPGTDQTLITTLAIPKFVAFHPETPDIVALIVGYDRASGTKKIGSPETPSSHIASKLIIVSTTTGKTIASKGILDDHQALAFSPDGRFLALGGFLPDYEIESTFKVKKQIVNAIPLTTTVYGYYKGIPFIEILDATNLTLVDTNLGGTYVPLQARRKINALAFQPYIKRGLQEEERMLEDEKIRFLQSMEGVPKTGVKTEGRELTIFKSFLPRSPRTLRTPKASAAKPPVPKKSGRPSILTTRKRSIKKTKSTQRPSRPPVPKRADRPSISTLKRKRSIKKTKTTPRPSKPPVPKKLDRPRVLDVITK